MFVVYVTEAFGPDERNAWLKDMAGEMDLDAASRAALGTPFETVDRGFRAWLEGQAGMLGEASLAPTRKSLELSAFVR